MFLNILFDLKPVKYVFAEKHVNFFLLFGEIIHVNNMLNIES